MLKAVTAVLVGRRWHVSCLHVTHYCLEKSFYCYQFKYRGLLSQAMLPVRTVEADSFSTFCAGGSRAACNMAPVTQEGCVLQHTVRGSCYFILKWGNGQGVDRY